MATSPSHTTFPAVRKPVPRELLVDRGTGTDFETRLAAVAGPLTPVDRFFIRSHSPTPDIDADDWRLRVDGGGVRRPLRLSYDELAEMPRVTVTATLECAGNGRRFFKETYGTEAEGVQWRLGAIGTAVWTGVRLRDVLDRAGLTDGARDVLPEGLDDHRGRRPMPLGKALADDTLLALTMNGETLPADHGFPARVVVPGWIGTASIKWLGRIEVSTQPLHVPWNTEEYVLAGPEYPARPPAAGVPITEMPVTSMLALDWPATLPAGRCTLRGLAYAGEQQVARVEVRVDDGPWRPAELQPAGPGAAAGFHLDWDAEPGEHQIRTRATDGRGRQQPDAVPWNDKGCCYHAVVAHPVTVR